MRALCGLRLAAGLLAILWCAACSSDRNSTPTAIATEFEPPASSCDVPELPLPIGTRRVVGSGSAASCTEQALRQALTEGGDISFDCGTSPAVIGVSEEILVSKDASIDGADLVTLDGGGATRILHTAARVSLTVRRVSFVRGHAQPSAEALGSGGAIRVGWLGKLNVFDCAFSDNVASAEGNEGGGAIYQSNGGAILVANSSFSGNSAVSGGAIDNLLSPMKLVGSTFANNHSFTGGGAVYDDGASERIDDSVGGDIEICGCRFENNLSVGQGGAVYLYAYPGDRFLVNQSAFIGNRVTRPSDGSALGGALRTGNAPLQLANSTFARNHADVHGGAYWTDGKAPVTIVNSTFVENEAGVPGVTDAGYGGALSGANMALSNCTLVGNHAAFSGGAISNEGDAWSIKNSIVADNKADNPWNQGQNCTHSMRGGSVLQWPAPGKGDTACTDDAVFAEPRLPALVTEGDAMPVLVPSVDSPALSAGHGCEVTDQRGQARGEPCDLGAVEVN